MAPVKLAVLTGLVVYLATQNELYHFIWLACNLLDTSKALRVARSIGRKIGVQTRRKAMREAMTCWLAYMAIQWLSGIPEGLFGCLPFYSPVKLVLFVGYMFTRTASSHALLETCIKPILKPYAAQIDLSLSLCYSCTALIVHYFILWPIATCGAVLRSGLRGVQRLLTAPFRILRSTRARLGAKVAVDSTFPSRQRQLTPVDLVTKGSAKKIRTTTTTRTPEPTAAKALSERSQPAALPTTPPAQRHYPTLPVLALPDEARSDDPAGGPSVRRNFPQTPEPATPIRSRPQANASLLGVPTVDAPTRRSPRKPVARRMFSPELNAALATATHDTSVASSSSARHAMSGTPTRDLMAALDALPDPPRQLPSTAMSAAQPAIPEPSALAPEIASTPPAAKSKRTTAVAKKPATPRKKAARPIVKGGSVAATKVPVAPKRKPAASVSVPPVGPSRSKTVAQPLLAAEPAAIVKRGSAKISAPLQTARDTHLPMATARTKVPSYRMTSPAQAEQPRPKATARTATKAGVNQVIDPKSGPPVGSALTGSKRKTSALGPPSKRIRRNET